MATFTATSSGMCSACFNRYTRGARLVLDPTGKAKHVTCGASNKMTTVLEKRLVTRLVR